MLLSQNASDAADTLLERSVSLLSSYHKKTAYVGGILHTESNICLTSLQGCS